LKGHSPTSFARHFAGRPRLAASLPARPGGGHRETDGHAEAPTPSPSREPGPTVEPSTNHYGLPARQPFEYREAGPRTSKVR
jgi:hypothetical protein